MPTDKGVMQGLCSLDDLRPLLVELVHVLLVRLPLALG
jgi:hypothetical protein